MTDTPPMPMPNAPGPGPGGQPSMRILAQFTRDLSFENPNAPDSLRQTAQSTPPAIDLGVEMNAAGRPDGFYEVDLKLSAKAQQGDKVAFQVELVYSGLFELLGFPQDQLEMILLIECPRFLFPFARRIIADAVGEGGFPPFQLEPIDFGAVYAAQRAQGGQSALQPSSGNA